MGMCRFRRISSTVPDSPGFTSAFPPSAITRMSMADLLYEIRSFEAGPKKPVSTVAPSLPHGILLLTGPLHDALNVFLYDEGNLFKAHPSSPEFQSIAFLRVIIIRHGTVAPDCSSFLPPLSREGRMVALVTCAFPVRGTVTSVQFFKARQRPVYGRCRIRAPSRARGMRLSTDVCCWPCQCLLPVLRHGRCPWGTVLCA